MTHNSPSPGLPPLLAERVTVQRGGRVVLREVSLGIAGGCVAVVGPNGAGKTTLLQTLLGLLTPASGRVLLDGQDVSAMRRREVARRVAYVAQSAEGFAGFTVRQVVEAARYPHRHPLEPLDASDAAAVDGAMRQCGLTELSARPLDTLSGGERQKAWIAAALAQASPIMLLDEPAAALDAQHQVELIRLIREQVAAGRTVVLVAHDLNFAAAVAEKCVALRGGSVAYDGPMSAFLESEALDQVFGRCFVRARDDRGRTWVRLDV
jgi:iron complex transport system ATP-binding protein